MRTHKKLLILMTWTASLIGHSTILPDNNLSYPVDELTSFLTGNETENNFHAVLDKGERLFGSLIENHYGVELNVHRLWEDDKVNASAMKGDTIWALNMYGGMARHPLNTSDGFTVVFCHELGHLIGGYPFKGQRNVANEGQSDYFASHACLKKMWSDEVVKNEISYENSSSLVKKACQKTWRSQVDQNLCARSINAGKVLAAILADLRDSETPHLITPDPTVVTKTYDSHPHAQCRLDTYFNASLCDNNNWDFTVVPGLRKTGEQKNNYSMLSEARTTSCMRKDNYTRGLRPKCWYKPE